MLRFYQKLIEIWVNLKYSLVATYQKDMTGRFKYWCDLSFSHLKKRASFNWKVQSNLNSQPNKLTKRHMDLITMQNTLDNVRKSIFQWYILSKHWYIQVNNNHLFITFFSWYRMAILSRARGSPQPVPSLTTASTSCVPRQRSINSQAKFIHCSSSARYSLWKALYLIQYCNRAHVHWVNGPQMSFLKL